MGGTDQGGYRAGGAAGGVERRLDGPEGEWHVGDEAFGGAAVEAPFVCFLEDAPVDVGAEDAAGGAGDGFAFAVAFAESALNLGGAGGSLEAKQAPDGIGDRAEEGVDGHAHAPVHEHAFAGATSAKVVEPFVAECLEILRDRDPDFGQDRDGLVPVSPFRFVPDRQLLLQPFAQRGGDFIPRVSGENEVRGVFQPVEADALAEADLTPAIHAAARSIRIHGTTTSSREAPPWPTTRSPSRTNADRLGASRAR